MNKAFIFDMDGVLVNSENAWEPYERPMLEQVLGKDVADAIGETVGVGIHNIYAKAKEAGSSVPTEVLAAAYQEAAMKVYDNAALTPGCDALAEKLIGWGFRLGVVSQSPRSWMDRVVPRLPFKDKLEVVLPLYGHPTLRLKPAPDGYSEVLRILEADAHTSFVLEDSNLGIASGKAAGAFTIGYRGNLVGDYEQHGADAYADTMEEVGDIVSNMKK